MLSPNQANQALRRATVDTTVLRDSYLLQALALLLRHGHLRAYAIAYALFPGRTASAGLAAAQRVLAGGIKSSYIVGGTDKKTSRRFYALTGKGARHLAENDRKYDYAHSTRDTLDALLSPPGSDQAATPDKKLRTLPRWQHREWASLITMASNQRENCFGLAEYELWGVLKDQLKTNFRSYPDALTFHVPSSTVVWHEVETSRRKRTYPNGETERYVLRDGNRRKEITGFRKLIGLIDHLRSASADFTYGTKLYRVARLVLHYRTNVIENELRALIEKTYLIKPDAEGEYWLNADHGARVQGPLSIEFSALLDSTDEAWPGQWSLQESDKNPLPFRRCGPAVIRPAEPFIVGYVPKENAPVAEPPHPPKQDFAPAPAEAPEAPWHVDGPHMADYPPECWEPVYRAPA